MPEPGPSDKGKLKLWQFSLRSLMYLMAGVALFLGLTQTRLLGRVFPVASIFILIFQFYLLVRLTAGGRFPAGWSLARGVGTCFVVAAYLVLGGKYMSPPFKSTYIVLFSASWLCWPSLDLLVRLARRASTTEEWSTLRRVSLIHLLVETSWLAIIFLAAWYWGIEIEWYGGSGEGEHAGIWFLAPLANSIPYLLWLSLFSPWRNIPQPAWPDSLFRWCLVVAFGIAVVSCLYGWYLATNRERLDEYYSSRGEYEFLWYPISLGLFFWLPQTVCGMMFALGVTCQLFRAHQDRWLIALGCIYFVPFWLLLLVAPRLMG
ncbi:MAG: hypothetical protein IAF94_08505 [Pirellulaceae bacterium]|nr:hypothetical protein [Pirellulaceae bacterium]